MRVEATEMGSNLLRQWEKHGLVSEFEGPCMNVIAKKKKKKNENLGDGREEEEEEVV